MTTGTIRPSAVCVAMPRCTERGGDDAVVVVIARVHLREVADGEDERAHEERQQVNFDDRSRRVVVEVGAQPFELGDIDFFDVSEVRNATLGDPASAARCCGAGR